jgi:hypothetical protein
LSPPDGAKDVGTDLREVVVEFDQDMKPIIAVIAPCNQALCYKNAFWRTPRKLVITASGRLTPAFNYKILLGARQKLQTQMGMELPDFKWQFKTR